ncbi:MAG: hypothetical protein UR27_C0014G0021 [Candidatus Peregrinibacteria bacterium GW2011_GWA2_33_10]|nr:MAG: hypothetical protein UR27_C0014G0021 [Candidatus Peregrinibacteria bacterium GW2011_GWA2_33_10]KKP38588.1 MAG: hypothetical protein UR30_C0017G0019 [Candidatus Peregrinibacteria bacterium GW2011_GWC2_33_13]OGJ46941.1 MAG: hypothetical protein A2229_03540 [Candidatus Peregrinibacteria bacterium RIFOXYA2_FULL_33_7]
MSDFEVFSGFDTADQMDEQAFERFKEQMKKNAAHIKSDQKQEAKQKEKEEKLAKILLAFMKRNKKMHLILLISRCLEENIPAYFILNLVLLGNEDIQEEVGVSLLLPEIDMQKLKRKEELNFTLRGQDPNSLINFDDGIRVLPLEIKIAIDLWGRNVFESAAANPHQILNRCFYKDENKEEKLKKVIINLGVKVLEDYMDSKNIEGSLDKYREFVQIMLQGIMKKIREQVENQRLLKGE